MAPTAPASSLDALREVIARNWGYSQLRPLQEQAMRAVLDGRDSLVVLPTGGGKSLCYQAPAALRGETTVVVSPLISLMKDQVDGLRACGIPALQIDSSQSPEERSANETELAQGSLHLVFVSPERLALPGFQRLLQRAGVRTFAIDEAHCISHWGHDFRPEYRQLNKLKELFPDASVHAYTATATERVRRDIVTQLALKNAEVLVGNFDRPNLTYRVIARRGVRDQILDVIERHSGEAGIVYCLRRRDVDELTAELKAHGLRAMPYHAGMLPQDRQATQNAFAAEQCDLVVATVAFGMGIDRSNIRFVLHTTMPKSIEHYQQETGRAGRDGLEAECVLLHSGADFLSWKSIMEKSALEPGVDASFLPAALQHLGDIDRYCRGAVCRHKALVEYFGQSYDAASCQACDLCLGDTEMVADGQVVAQKILSCVARVKERFGIGHVVGVLRGEQSEKIRKFSHDKVSTFGLLRDRTKEDLRDWVYQLVGQGVLLQEGDPYPLLRLNSASWEVMKGDRQVRLVQPSRRTKAAKSAAARDSWEGVDQPLFEALRGHRRELAAARSVPPYIVCSDATLRELARVRPSGLEAMRRVYGIGDRKLRDFGEPFLRVIEEHSQRRGLTRDCSPHPEPAKETFGNGSRAKLAFELFRRQGSIQEVMRQTARAQSTVIAYLAEFIRAERPPSLSPWVSPRVYERVVAAARQVGSERLTPIFIALGKEVSYDEIKLVVEHLKGGGGSAPS